MPQIFVDGHAYSTSSVGGETTLGELLMEVMTSLAGSRKMISEVSIDGIPLTPDSVRQAAERPTAGVEIMTLKTITYQQLTHFGLQRTVLLVLEVIRQAELSAEHFRTAPQDEANRLYVACLDDLQLLVDAVDQTLQLQDGSPTNGGHRGQESLKRNLQKLAAITGELLNAYRKDDVMVVADVLTYELVPVLKHMQQGLEACLTQIQAA